MRRASAEDTEIGRQPPAPWQGGHAHFLIATTEGSAVSFARSEIEPFRCELEPRRASVHVRPIGELDLATVPAVESELLELRAAGFTSLVLDLRGVRFLDSTALHLILDWHAMAEADGISFGLLAGPPAVQRLFELSGLTERLRFVDPLGVPAPLVPAA
jgi:anti-sigma B factor antagonist